MATHELVVPRSIPIIFPIVLSLLFSRYKSSHRADCRTRLTLVIFILVFHFPLMLQGVAHENQASFKQFYNVYHPYIVKGSALSFVT
jgi:hypothetical protein